MKRSTQGFTMVEVLSVTAVMALLAFLVAPSLGGLQNAGSFNKALRDISLTLSQARSYALAHNTYVFVGFEETNVTSPASGPQTAATALSNGGRVYVGVVATQDGTSGYDPTNPASGWTNPNTVPAGANLVAIQKQQFFNNLHLTTGVPATGSLIRPAVDPAYKVGLGSFTSYTPFRLPLGAAQPVASYSEVIQFDPQGQVTLQSSASGGGIAPWVEIGLQATHGTLSANGNNQAAIQIDGSTGAVVLYRP